MRLKPLVLTGNGIVLVGLAVAQVAGDFDPWFLLLLVPAALNIVLAALWL